MKQSVESTQSPEERIREAARRLFIEKGYDGTTSRDLAEATGLNVSMTNYYFRSKAKLFQLTFQDLHRLQFARLQSLVNLDLPLREKIIQLLEAEYELLQRNPDLPLFILTEAHRHPDLFTESVPASPFPSLNDTLFAQQVREAVASGEMRPVTPLQVIMLIASNVQYPFVGRTVISRTMGVTNEELLRLIGEQQPLIQAMVLGYLFPEEN